MNLPLSKYSLILIILGMTTLPAQEKKEPAERGSAAPERADAPLPKIDLPEFLITGHETIDLPPSSKGVAGEERFFLPDSQLPLGKDAGLIAASKPQKGGATSGEQMNGRVETSFGNYTTPSVQGWFGKNYDEGGILFNAEYASTNGHTTNSGSQKTGLGIQGDYFFPQSSKAFAGARLNAGMGFAGTSYRSYGSIHPSQLRSWNDVRLNLALSSRTGIAKLEDPLEYSMGISWNGTSLNDSLNASDNGLGLSGSASTRSGDFQLRGTIEYTISSVSMPFPAGLGTQSPQWFALRLSARTSLAPSLQMLLMVQQFFYRGIFTTTSGRLLPEVEFRYSASDALTLFGGFNPSVERNTLSSLAAANRFMRNSVELQPTAFPVSIAAGAEFAFSSRLSAKGTVTYRTARDYPAFVENSSAKVWDVMYLPDATVTGGSVEGTYLLSDVNAATLAGSLNSVSLKDSSNTLPNIPSLSLSGLYSHSFGNGVMIEVLGTYVSKRWIDFAHSASNAGFFTIGGKAEYQVFERLRAILRCENLLDRQYYVWDGYQERPLFISLGVTYKW